MAALASPESEHQTLWPARDVQQPVYQLTGVLAAACGFPIPEEPVDPQAHLSLLDPEDLLHPTGDSVVFLDALLQEPFHEVASALPEG